MGEWIRSSSLIPLCRRAVFMSVPWMVWKVSEEDGPGNMRSRRAATRFSSAANDATWTSVSGRESNSAARARIVLAWPLSELVMKRIAVRLL